MADKSHFKADMSYSGADTFELKAHISQGLGRFFDFSREYEQSAAASSPILRAESPNDAGQQKG